MPCTLTYIAKRTEKLPNNITLSNGATNTTQFPLPLRSSGSLRDTHVNDAFDGVCAWAWTDNSMIADQTNGTTNCMVAIGTIDSNGNLIVGSPIQLTDLAPGIFCRSSSVAINRADKKNIVVSYRYTNINVTPRQYIGCRAVSFDGGVTWDAPYNGINPLPFNGPVIPEVNVPNDNLGVKSDQYGNIWYSFSGLNNDPATPPNFFVSMDLGVTFTHVYTGPDIQDFGTDSDYPQYCFGGDGLGNYGMWWQSSIFGNDVIPSVGFIPVYGPGIDNIDVLAATFTTLPQYTNSLVETDLAASSDGRLWLQGYPFVAYTYVSPQNIGFKSPGMIYENYAGAWDYLIYNGISRQFNIDAPLSQPGFIGYIPNSTQSIVYDEQRSALYALGSAQSPDYSQNMRIYFIISRDNGMTWSNPIDIATTVFANRGFQSMALDTVMGNLVFGWYDGRNDPSYESVEYMAAIIPASKLDALVFAIPLSNPLFEIPAAN